MKYLSLFSGIGGFEKGICDAKVGWECVGFSETDKYAIATYMSHYAEHKNYGDITKIKPKDLPYFDLICGGFPCQSFSIAGKRKGFADRRGNMFFEIMRIASERKTPYLFLENVKGLLNHDKGRTFGAILRSLDEHGYDAEWSVLNSKHHGVPQNRERVFIIASLRGKPKLKVFPIQRTSDGNIKYAHFDRCQTYRILKTEGISSCLSTCATGGRHVPKIMTTYGIRALTPTEFERLQGFPDGWTHGKDSVQYKQLGNAVTTNVICDIVSQMRIKT